MTKPFERGDHLVVGRKADEIAGVVDSMDLRYTYLRRPIQYPLNKDEIVMIPNSVVYRSPLVVTTDRDLDLPHRSEKHADDE